jgi:hypothetical protein
MAEHRQHGDDDCEGKGPPEAPPKVSQFWISFVLDARQLGLERHPAFRAGSLAVLPDLRMHGADVDGGRLRGDGRRRRFWRNILERLRSEFRPARLATEVGSAALVLVPKRRILRDGHAAHGILQWRCCRC